MRTKIRGILQQRFRREAVGKIPPATKAPTKVADARRDANVWSRQSPQTKKARPKPPRANRKTPQGRNTGRSGPKTARRARTQEKFQQAACLPNPTDGRRQPA